MVGRIVRFVVLFGLALVGSSGVLAQPGGAEERIEAMRAAYERLDYDTAVRHARDALADYEAYSVDQLVDVHTTLGLVLYARNEPLEARTQFAAALGLDPSLRLDPLLVSPKTLEFFDEVRAEAARPASASGGEAEVRYVRVYDPRPGATMRSLVVPGWGQLHKGERAKGWALVGMWGATAAGALAAHLARDQARDEYLAATTPAEIADRYDTFNRWHQTRTALALSAAAVWAYAAFDALAFGGPEQRNVDIGPVGAGFGVRVGL